MGSTTMIETEADARERDGFNAAFRELGLSCRLDAEAFRALKGLSDEERVRRYFETHAPHLLRAYDAQFLVDTVCEAKLACDQRAPRYGRASRAEEFAAGQTGF